MRIRRIELRGFKSFVERTELQLGSGICAVVGPNGCGKSNIIDAIKWTLGEQSPSTLRGRAMEDVIFAGSDGVRPAGVAEVTVAFDNSDGSFGGSYARFDEIEVGRQLHRNGRSDYLLNRTSCRRKDIISLFLDTGVGARAYSIIEQGRVEFVIGARPEERRILIDEVAGINRFKTQRAEAERRMKRTRENLVRLADLMQELGRQRRQLQSQASRARRFKELRGQWREAGLKALVATVLFDGGSQSDLEAELQRLRGAEGETSAALQEQSGETGRLREAAAVARRRHDELRERRASVEGRLQLGLKEVELRREEQASLTERAEQLAAEASDGKKREQAVGKELRLAEKNLVKARERLRELDAGLSGVAAEERAAREAATSAIVEVESTKSKMLATMTEAARVQNLLGFLERRVAEAEEQLASRSERIGQAAEQLKEASKELEAQEALLARAGTARQALVEAGEAAGVTVGKVEAELEAAVQQFERSAGALRVLEARLSSLTQLIEGLEGLGAGTQALAASPDAGVVGIVADLLQPPQGLEAAVELVLGERLQAVVVEDLRRAVGPARQGGRVLLVPRDAASEPAPGSLAEEVLSDPRAPGLAARLLGEARLGEDPATVEDRNGLWVPGVDERGEGLLAQRRMARELAEERVKLQQAAEESLRERGAVERKLGDALGERARLARESHAAELHELSCRRDLDEVRGRCARLADAVQHAEGEERALLESLQKLKVELVASGTELDLQSDARAGLEARLSELREVARRAEASRDTIASQSSALRIELAGAQQATAGYQRELRRLQAQEDDLERRRLRAAARSEALSARSEHLLSLVARLKREGGELEAERTLLESELASAAAAREESAVRWQQGEESLRELQARSDGLRRELASLEVRHAEARGVLQSSRARAAEEFDVDLTDLVARLAEEDRIEHELVGGHGVQLDREELLAAGEAASQREAARTLAGRIERLGPVNLAADEEFREVDTRWTEFVTQREDLEAALADLKKAIFQIEKETRERFTEAFEAVSAGFSALYPRLVGGGRAELTLTEPKAPLRTGIEILVEPPGKRPQSLGLLSGGEKAMAALALVFAVFQVKPSPFCLLDEVDASLDDANSRRFNGMLREMASETQFIVVTHNRTTMEVADRLYGVTMQKPGVSSVVSVRL